MRCCFKVPNEVVDVEVKVKVKGLALKMNRALDSVAQWLEPSPKGPGFDF